MNSSSLPDAPLQVYRMTLAADSELSIVRFMATEAQAEEISAALFAELDDPDDDVLPGPIVDGLVQQNPGGTNAYLFFFNLLPHFKMTSRCPRTTELGQRWQEQLDEGESGKAWSAAVLMLHEEHGHHVISNQITLPLSADPQQMLSALKEELGGQLVSARLEPVPEQAPPLWSEVAAGVGAWLEEKGKDGMENLRALTRASFHQSQLDQETMHTASRAKVRL